MNFQLWRLRVKAILLIVQIHGVCITQVEFLF